MRNCQYLNAICGNETVSRVEFEQSGGGYPATSAARIGETEGLGQAARACLRCSPTAGFFGFALTHLCQWRALPSGGPASEGRVMSQGERRPSSGREHRRKAAGSRVPAVGHRWDDRDGGDEGGT